MQLIIAASIINLLVAMCHLLSYVSFIILVWELLAALNDDTPRNYRHLSMIISLPTGVVSKECTAICVTFKN